MKKLRKIRGQAIAETGPALFVLLVLIFFPLLDLLAVGMQFCCGWYLNHEASHELSVSKYADWSTALSQIKQKFDNTGIPQFAHMVSGVHSYTNIPASTATGMPARLNCQTTIICKPFLMIPMFTKVAGINANMTISFTQVTTWETYDPTDPSEQTQTTQTYPFTE